MIAIAISAAALALGGPISKFADKPPAADYVSAASIGDIERCLIDMDGHFAPHVYRQPDRPDKVTLIWTVDERAHGRVDLEKVQSGTRVLSWLGSKQVAACAPH